MVWRVIHLLVLLVMHELCLVYIPDPGVEWNPIISQTRLYKCWCLSASRSLSVFASDYVTRCTWISTLILTVHKLMCLCACLYCCYRQHTHRLGPGAIDASFTNWLTDWLTERLHPGYLKLNLCLLCVSFASYLLPIEKFNKVPYPKLSKGYY